MSVSEKKYHRKRIKPKFITSRHRALKYDDSWIIQGDFINTVYAKKIGEHDFLLLNQLNQKALHY